jgi:hypothetical protein
VVKDFLWNLFVTLTTPCPCLTKSSKNFSIRLVMISTALAWLEERDIDAAPILKTVGKIALIQCGTVWNPDTGRYRFMIYTPAHVGPKYPPELAIPIIEDGKFVDLLFISDEMSFVRATCRAPWLGRENLTLPVVRLHAHPMNWLESGCTGVCHIEPISRKALAELRNVETIECNDIHTAVCTEN